MMKREIWIGMVVLTTGACAGNAEPRGPEVGREPPAREVAVENWTGLDLQVFAIYGGDITRIGKVRSVSSRVFRLPDAAGGEIRLITQPVGTWETRHFSEPVSITFGQRITWQLRATGGSAITYRPAAAMAADRTAGHRVR